jgi:hypothetical protein
MGPPQYLLSFSGLATPRGSALGVKNARGCLQLNGASNGRILSSSDDPIGRLFVVSGPSAPFSAWLELLELFLVSTALFRVVSPLAARRKRSSSLVIVFTCGIIVSTRTDRRERFSSLIGVFSRDLDDFDVSARRGVS